MLVWLIRPGQSRFWSDTLWSVAATAKGLKRNRRQYRRVAASESLRVRLGFGLGCVHGRFAGNLA
jgi:hypothetical protein